MDKSLVASQEAGKAFIGELYQTVIGAGEKSLIALEELSDIALGGHKEARNLIAQIDGKVSAGELVLPKVDNTKIYG